MEPRTIVAAVRERLGACRAVGQPLDYVTFVPDGEPTLDRDLGETIRGVGALGVPVAVITNGSLAWDAGIRSTLAAAAFVSLKVDTVDSGIWHRLNRPVGGLRLDTVLDGMRAFADHYQGELASETMLVAGLNDHETAVAATAAFVSALEPTRAYVAVPTRPPAEPWVRAPDDDVVRRAIDAFRDAEIPTSPLVQDLEDPFVAVGGHPAQGLLGILAVHPMPEPDARAYLVRAGAGWSVAERLIDEGRITRTTYRGRTFLRRVDASAGLEEQRRTR